MNLDPDAEEAVLEKIDTALREAVEAKNLSWANATRVKRQKYTNIALDKFLPETEDPPITRSWFKYGETQPLSPSGPNTLDFSTSPDSKYSGGPSIGQSHEEPRNKNHRPISEVPKVDFFRFFHDEVDSPPLEAEYWQMSDLDFLEVYYQEHAPPNLRDVYLANIKIRQLLTAVRSDVGEIYDRRVELFTDEKSDSLPDLVASEYYERIGRAAVKLRLAMRSHPNLFDQSLPLIRKTTDLIEDVLMQLESLPRKSITRPHSRILQELLEFYDEEAWLLAAYEMSEHTAEGPQAETLRGIARQNLERDISSFDEKYSRLQRDCAEQGLLPNPGDFPSTERPEALNNMMSIIDSPVNDE